MYTTRHKSVRPKTYFLYGSCQDGTLAEYLFQVTNFYT